MNVKKILQQFLEIINYARNYIENLAKLRNIKERVKDLKPLELPLDDNYFIIEIDASKLGCGAILKQKHTSTLQS